MYLRPPSQKYDALPDAERQAWILKHTLDTDIKEDEVAESANAVDENNAISCSPCGMASKRYPLARSILREHVNRRCAETGVKADGGRETIGPLEPRLGRLGGRRGLKIGVADRGRNIRKSRRGKVCTLS